MNALRAEVGTLDIERDELAELVADLNQALAALSQNATFPADVNLARAAINNALARIGGGQ